MAAGRIRFVLNASLDPDQLAERFAAAGRIQIADLLAGDGADRLRGALAASSGWRHVINGTDHVFEIPSGDLDRMDPGERKRIDAAVHASAAAGFQFRFDTIRVPDSAAERRASGSVLDAFAEFLSSPETLAFVGMVTGERGLAFADAQATRYRPGDFLTGHDDAVAGKNRRLAYVLGLAADWRVEHGGLLLFHDADGGVADTFVPRLNALSLFRIGQRHSVSVVAPFAPQPRVSVTGWFRTSREP